jgi:hypothetical protein
VPDDGGFGAAPPRRFCDLRGLLQAMTRERTRVIDIRRQRLGMMHQKNELSH